MFKETITISLPNRDILTHSGTLFPKQVLHKSYLEKNKGGFIFMKLTPALGVNLADFPTSLPTSILDGKRWRVTKKVDGVRRLFYKKSSTDITAWSRTNKQDIWLTHICNFLSSSRFPDERVYDCELVDRELYFSMEDSFILRSETNSKASQQYPDNKRDLMAICFDSFDPNGDLRPTYERTIELQRIFVGVSFDDPVQLIPIYGYISGSDMEMIQRFLDREILLNGEGLMLQDLDAPYIPGRSRALIKVKKMKEFIGRIIDVEIANNNTKIAGGVAAVICEVEGCTTPVRVGSGFNNRERYEMATDQNLIGKKIEIEAFSYSKNRQGYISLNLPVFKRFVGNEQ